MQNQSHSNWKSRRKDPRFHKSTRERLSRARHAARKLRFESLEGRALPAGVDIVDVTPDPRNKPVDAVTVDFAVNLTDVTAENFQLLRDGENVALDGITLVQVNPKQYVVNLANVTAEDGLYELNFLPKNPTERRMLYRAGGTQDFDSWLMDTVAPTASMVLPTVPVNQPVGWIKFNFTEPVSGVSVDDFQMTKNGQSISLANASVSEISSTQFALDLDGMTLTEGNYEVRLVAQGSGILDEAGNLIAADVVESWYTDAMAPTAQFDLPPTNSLVSSVQSVTLNFDEPVSGVSLDDFQLTRDSKNIDLSELALTQVSSSQYTLSFLSLTRAEGDYELRVTAAASNILDGAGNALSTDIAASWTSQLITDVGMLGMDELTGDIWATRFDGSEYVQEEVWNLDSGNQWQSALAADTNGDDRTDLVVRDAKTGNWWRIQYDGTTFENANVGNWKTSTGYSTFMHGDIDGDGKQDVIGRADNGVWWALVSTPTGYTNRFLVGWNPTSTFQNFMIADIDGDGRDNVIGQDASNGNWWAIRPNGNGYTSQRMGNWAISQNFTNISTLDMNGDGSDELVGFNSTTGDWRSIEFNGTGFSERVIANWNPADNWLDIALGDIDGDGGKDILGRGAQTGNWWAVRSRNGQFTSEKVGNWNQLHTYTSIQVADTNGDGTDDLVGRDDTGSWWTTSYDGTQLNNVFLRGWNTNVDWQNLITGDIDGDGTDNIVGWNADTGEWWVIRKIGDQFTSQKMGTWDRQIPYENVQFVDMDGDGAEDIVALDKYRGDWSWLRFDGATFTTQVIGHWEPTHQLFNYADLKSIDVDGEDGVDLVGFDAQQGNWWGTMFHATGVTQEFLGHWDPSVAWTHVRYGDIDGDGSQDIVGWNPSSGEWWAIRHTDAGYINQAIYRWNPTNSYSPVELADLNGDGRQDIVARDSLGQWWTIQFNGKTFVSQSPGGWNDYENWQNITIVDIDGDGRADLLGRNPTSGNWQAIRYKSGKFVDEKIGNWHPADSYSVVLTADVNGDGILDLVGRGSSGSWWAAVYQGSALRNVALRGWNTTIPWRNFFAADLDGDLRAEVIGQDGSNGNWWAIRYGANGYYSQLIGNWSTSDAYANIQTIDIDGDNRSDIVGRNSVSGDWRAIQFHGSAFESRNLLNWSPGTAWKHVLLGDMPGVSSATLRKRIIDDIPGILDTINSDPLLGAQKLLTWSSNAVDFDSEGGNAHLPVDILAPNRTAPELFFSVFDKNRGGGWCGWYADFYVQVLRLFGYEHAFTIGFGDAPHNMSHVTVAVPIQVDGEWKNYLLDPTFNARLYNNTTGELLTIEELITEVTNGNAANVDIVTGPLESRDWLSSTPLDYLTLRTEAVDTVFMAYEWPDYSLNYYLESTKPAFVNYGYSTGIAGFVELIKYRVVSIYPYSPDSVPARQFLEFLESMNIPYGP